MANKILSDTEKTIHELCSRNPYYFATQFAYTFDPDDELTKIKRFPDLEYLKILFRLMNTERVLWCPKSSQMKFSWSSVLFFLWKALFRPGEFILFQSSKQNKSGWGGGDTGEEGGKGSPLTLIGRAYRVYENLPDFLKVPITPTKEPPSLVFNHRVDGKNVISTIKAISSVGEDARSWTPTGSLMDEVAFQPEAEEAFMATIARLTTKGHLIGVSTPNHKEFFHYKTYDDGSKDFVPLKDYSFKISPHAKKLREGMWFWRNPKNRIAVCMTHYHSDPNKCTPEWKALRQQGFGGGSAAWEREFEINFDVEGEYKRIFYSFNPEVHIASVQPDPNLPIITGWDWGGNHPAILWLQIMPSGVVKILKEFNGKADGQPIQTRDLGLEFWKITNFCYPNYAIENFCDRSGTFKSDKSPYSNVELLDPLDIHFSYHYERSILKGVALIDAKLSERIDGMPGIIVDPSCQTLIDGFLGGYRWDKLGNQPLKDGIYEHGMDALRYIIASKFSPETIKSLNPDKPSPPPIDPMEAFTSGALAQHRRGRIIEPTIYDDTDY